MRIKHVLLALACAAAAFLCGCSGEKAVVCENGTAAVKNAHIKIEFPEDYEITTGDKVYKTLYEQLSEEYGSARELKQSFEDSGERVLLEAHSDSASVMLMELDKENISIVELMQSVHNNEVFEYRVSGFYTESSLEETEWGGVSGVMSVIRVFDEKDAPLLTEEREFCFESGEKVYTLQISGIEEQVRIEQYP